VVSGLPDGEPIEVKGCRSVLSKGKLIDCSLSSWVKGIKVRFAMSPLNLIVPLRCKGIDRRLSMRSVRDSRGRS